MADPTPPNHPHAIWTIYVAPTARALEAFFWRLAWFSVIICVFANYNPLKPPAAKEKTQPVVKTGSESPRNLASVAR